jgi:hypothetical protein
VALSFDTLPIQHPAFARLYSSHQTAKRNPPNGWRMQVWVVGKGGVKKWTKGGVGDYAASRLERIQKAAATAAAAAAARRGSGS